LAKKLLYLNYGIATVLAFIGAKIMLGHFVTIPVVLSLGIVVGLLGLATVASLVLPQRLKK
jgi:tellurite resistance protein TerC